MSGQNYDYFIKVLLIGESGVGKTCILLRFSEDSFPIVHQTTIGVDFKQKMINYKDKSVKIQIWDTAGQERFRTLTNSFYKKANGIILVYDVTNENSFFNVKNWLKQVDLLADPGVIKMIVGNKCDEDSELRKVKFEDGEKLAKEMKIPYFETSAKNNVNITHIFNQITKFIIDRIDKTSDNMDEVGTRISILKDDFSHCKEQKQTCYC